MPIKNDNTSKINSKAMMENMFKTIFYMFTYMGHTSQSPLVAITGQQQLKNGFCHTLFPCMLTMSLQLGMPLEIQQITLFYYICLVQFTVNSTSIIFFKYSLFYSFNDQEFCCIQAFLFLMLLINPPSLSTPMQSFLFCIFYFLQDKEHKPQNIATECTKKNSACTNPLQKFQMIMNGLSILTNLLCVFKTWMPRNSP